MNLVERYRNKNMMAQFEQTKELYAKLKENVAKQREYKDWLVDVAYGKLHHDCKGISCETCSEALIGLDILAKEKFYAETPNDNDDDTHRENKEYFDAQSAQEYSEREPN